MAHIHILLLMLYEDDLLKLRSLYVFMMELPENA